MSRDIIDILIDIYEAEMYGDISTDERDFLISWADVVDYE